MAFNSNLYVTKVFYWYSLTCLDSSGIPRTLVAHTLKILKVRKASFGAHLP